MLKLKKISAEPEWIEVLGARFLFAPITRSMHRRSRREAFAASESVGDASDIAFGEAIGDAISDTLIMEGLLDWEGVGDDNGNPLPCTPENKKLLLDDPALFDALDAAYVMPFALRIAEGNGLRVSPNGIGPGETRAGGTAGSSAKPGARRGAKAAPIARKRQRQPRAKKSGKH